MALIDVLTAVNQELRDAAVIPADAPLYFGASPRSMKTYPSSIYWVPRSGKGMPANVAMRRSDMTSAAAAGKDVQKAIYVRAAAVDAHIWAGGFASGDDFSATELLLNQVVVACHRRFYGSFEYTGDDWMMSGTDSVLLGHRLVVHFNFYLPLVDPPVASGVASGSGSGVQVGSPTTIILLTSTQTDSMGPIPPGNTTTSTTP